MDDPNHKIMLDKYQKALAALIEIADDPNVSYGDKEIVLSDLWEEVGIVLDALWDAEQAKGDE